MRLPLKAALLAGIPLVIMTAIGASLLIQGQTADGRSTLAVGVIVAAVSGGTVIYRIDRWSLPKQSLAHLALMAVTVLPALFLSGWFPLDSAAGVLAVVGIFAATGVVLWTAVYTTFRLISAGGPDADARTR
ncbi:DUF3021 domain-containing protein [Corynebacterium variabile]|uniref:DUF3021 domain-containing protein n=1 Tax=Corynebacterium variabile TaxID=1727 RepID=UPI001DF8D121|nr:DUF3021 domain-containing protein [Corynebacterium variabile]HJG46371.1 DUF3021 domain-containing protein [Corynebacterium variabile]